MYRYVLLTLAAGLFAALPLAASGSDEGAAAESDEPVKLVTTFWVARSRRKRSRIPPTPTPRKTPTWSSR